MPRGEVAAYQPRARHGVVVDDRQPQRTRNAFSHAPQTRLPINKAGAGPPSPLHPDIGMRVRFQPETMTMPRRMGHRGGLGPDRRG